MPARSIQASDSEAGATYPFSALPELGSQDLKALIKSLHDFCNSDSLKELWQKVQQSSRYKLGHS